VHSHKTFDSEFRKQKSNESICFNNTFRMISDSICFFFFVFRANNKKKTNPSIIKKKILLCNQQSSLFIKFPYLFSLFGSINLMVTNHSEKFKIICIFSTLGLIIGREKTFHKFLPTIDSIICIQLCSISVFDGNELV
jgi:hypothetical protein